MSVSFTSILTYLQALITVTSNLPIEMENGIQRIDRSTAKLDYLTYIYIYLSTKHITRCILVLIHNKRVHH